MIIWGSTGRTTVAGQGDFHCPQCQHRAPYTHYLIQRYFTLYFIPLFPTNTVAEYVQCQGCGGNFDPRVLHLSAEEVQGLVEPWACSHCQNVNPAAEMRCARCQEPRSQRLHGAGQSFGGASAEEVLAPIMPQPMPRRAEKKKREPDEHWQQTSEPGRCRECGVMNTRYMTRCRACGGEVCV
jgi:hypothetical protein